MKLSDKAQDEVHKLQQKLSEACGGRDASLIMAALVLMMGKVIVQVAPREKWKAAVETTYENLLDYISDDTQAKDN